MGHGYHVPKLCVEITPKQAARIKLLFPHGTLKPTIGLILDELFELMDTHGSGAVLGAVITKQARPSAVLPTMRKVVEDAKHTTPKDKF
jgi:hypothetical protein